MADKTTPDVDPTAPAAEAAAIIDAAEARITEDLAEFARREVRAAILSTYRHAANRLRDEASTLRGEDGKPPKNAPGVRRAMRVQLQDSVAIYRRLVPTSALLVLEAAQDTDLVADFPELDT